MPASLVTNWKRIAQSGPTVDGRIIKPKWLTDMAETYNPKVYKAKLWVDHMRYTSFGSVEALKVEEDEDVVRLFAKISPNRSLLQINQIWEEKLHFSIEPTEDFAKTGKCYLTGLGMTDQPASLGTDEMRFANFPGREFTARYPGEVVPDLREFDEDQEIERFGQKIARWFFKMNEPKQEEEEAPMDEKLLKEFMDSIEATRQTVTDMATNFEKFMTDFTALNDKDEPTGDQNDNTPAATEDNTQFDLLKTSLEDLSKRFDTIVERLEKAAAGTPFTETTAPAEGQDELL